MLAARDQDGFAAERRLARFGLPELLRRRRVVRRPPAPVRPRSAPTARMEWVVGVHRSRARMPFPHHLDHAIMRSQAGCAEEFGRRRRVTRARVLSQDAENMLRASFSTSLQLSDIRRNQRGSRKQKRHARISTPRPPYVASSALLRNAPCFEALAVRHGIKIARCASRAAMTRSNINRVKAETHAVRS